MTILSYICEIEKPAAPDRVVKYRALDDDHGPVLSVTISGTSMTLKERGDGWSDWYALFPVGQLTTMTVVHDCKDIAE